ncbi:MAG TPA: methylmalonyl Co-A mutase-associated GTPase MeaB, partial [Xanthomarina gelatinilytica]|nr:methylmalonyl Co-A mutase-associated GTPase MeaB [Xanthomarina gelatinilytica]
MAKEKKSALEEKKGIQEPESINRSSIARIKSKRHKQPSTEDLISGILQP